MMVFKKILFVLVIGSLFFGLTSCKKEEKEKTYKSFKNIPEFTLKPFVQVGDLITVTPAKVYPEDGDAYGYAWKVSPVMASPDTTKRITDPESVAGTFTFQIPDTLCNLEFRCTAFNPDYYSASATHVAAIIDKEKSISGQDFRFATGTFTDERDNKTYHIVRIGDLEWFCSNLAYEGYGEPYMSSSVTSDVFGQFYNWEEANLACPTAQRWRLPTEDDWVALANELDPQGKFNAMETFVGMTGHLISNAIFNGEKDSLWEFWPKITVTNEKSMNVLPFGYCTSDGSTFAFNGFGKTAAFWTGTTNGEDQAIYRYFNEGDPDILVSSVDKMTFYTTVRCVRDYIQP